MTDYERGRLAGYAEGVEAAAKTCDTRAEECAELSGVSRVIGGQRIGAMECARRIRALRAPSPATGPADHHASCSIYRHPFTSDNAANRAAMASACDCRAPSPAAGAEEIPEDEPRRATALRDGLPHICAFNCPCGGLGRDPSPKEDAPRCEACGGSGKCRCGFPHVGNDYCDACGGTGRSTTGGSK